MAERDKFTPVATQVPYDNTDSGLIAEDTKAAIDEIVSTVATSASPGFGFGKGGNLSNGSYLECEGVPSNISGRYVYINDAVITRVFISVQNAATFDIEVFHHDGSGVNITSLGTVSIVSSTGGEFTVNWIVPTSKQLAMRILNGSAKNAVGGLELQGTN
jgi:hypothetical protein